MAAPTMSPTSDTKSKVVMTFLDKPTFSCSRCTAVIVREFARCSGVSLGCTY